MIDAQWQWASPIWSISDSSLSSLTNCIEIFFHAGWPVKDWKNHPAVKAYPAWATIKHCKNSYRKHFSLQTACLLSCLQAALYNKPSICHASRAKTLICHARRVGAMRKTKRRPNGNPYLPCKTLDHLQKEASLYIKRPSAMQTGPKRLSVMQTVCKPRASQRANRRKTLSTMQTVGFFLRKRKLYYIIFFFSKRIQRFAW